MGPVVAVPLTRYLNNHTIMSVVRKEIDDEMVGWHHQLDGHEFEQALRVGETGKPGVLQSMGSQSVNTIEQLN